MKKVLIIAGIVVVLGFLLVHFAFNANAPGVDAVAVHFAIHASMKAETSQAAATTLTYLLDDILTQTNEANQSRDNFLRTLLNIAVATFAVSGVLVYIYFETKFLKPFRKIKSFAHAIAAGSLHTPLEMDKDNLFGAFTESFDIMREELLKARENEIKLSKSKKELVVSLTHDINTPVASVRSAIDVLRIKTDDPSQVKILNSASDKLEQIDSLVTNLFQSTLEELQELKVEPKEVQSTEVHAVIVQADYQELCNNFTIPDCIIIADIVRLQQVFDNVVHNSYKYAGTKINVNAFIEEDYLFIEIKDFGSGVSESELHMVFNKFYRGANVSDKDGYGLGLYLAKSFAERMGGGLYCENHEDGFAAIITLSLAGK